MTCYTVETADGTVARVHADQAPSARSLEAIRSVIDAAGRMMRERCENCGEPADGKSRDEVPLCDRCAAEIAKAYRDKERREEWREECRRDVFGEPFE